jgi:hypothetical protein
MGHDFNFCARAGLFLRASRLLIYSNDQLTLASFASKKANYVVLCFVGQSHGQR